MEESLPRPTPAARPLWRVFPAAAVLVAAGVLAYCNSFQVPFVFDDLSAIHFNVFLRRLWPLTYSLQAPLESSVAGRPVVSFTLALNYAWGGYRVQGYHALNIAIHLAAALTLFGLVRQTILLSSRSRAMVASATPIALVIALLWQLHPLQTESVTYTIQRAESLCGLFYLLTMYGLVRGIRGPTHVAWYAAAVVACGLGMASKEVMATAPLVVLAFDRIFFARSFVEQVRRRGLFYLGLFATWGILAWLNIGGPRAGSAGFSVESSTPLSYALTQFGVILHYLRLSFVPYPLCLDYAWPLATDPLAIIGPGIVIAALVAATVWALRRRPAWGFLGLWFFVILGPTSSIIPIEDRAFEHRMYLPLAAICVLVVIGIYSLTQRALAAQRITSTGARALCVGLPALVAVLFTGLTLRRNYDYRSEIAVWEDVVAKRPDNPRGYDALGTALFKVDRLDEAYALYRKVLARWPDYPDSHQNLGMVLTRKGRYQEAVASYRESIRLAPGNPAAHFNLGLVLVEIGQPQDALREFGEAILLEPEYPEAHHAAGKLLVRLGRLEQAVEQFQEALLHKPDWARAQNDLGNALAKLGRTDEAIVQFREALRREPDWPEVHSNLGIALAKQGRFADAIAEFETAIRLKPEALSPHNNLAQALMKQGRVEEALDRCRRAARARPDTAEPLYQLGQLLMQAGRREEAGEQFRAALKIDPNHRGAAARLQELTAMMPAPISTTQPSN